MLSPQDNQRLCRVGPGTPMGEVFRRFWNPILLAGELPAAGADPVRVRILGEDLVAFRSGSGEMGLIEEWCPHRRVSLALGRIEPDGLRCLYHGWKFDIEGRLLDTPNAQDSRIRERLRARAYPIRESGGFLWAYMGPPDREPPFPHWRFMDVAAENRHTVQLDSGSNYMQVLEGGTDTTHVGLLHANFSRPGWADGTFNRNPDQENPAAFVSDDLMPQLELEDTDFGYHYAAIRTVPPSGDVPMHNVRIHPIVMPSTRIIPARELQTVLFEVPIDDENTRTLSVGFRNDGGPFDKQRYEELRGRNNTRLIDAGNRRYVGSWANRFGQDRSTMERSWSGIEGIVLEDLAMSMSPGPIVDRTGEHLVAADAAVVRARRQLLESARLVEAGQDPIGVRADLSVVVGCDRTVPVGSRWQDLVPGHQARGTHHPS